MPMSNRKICSLHGEGPKVVGRLAASSIFEADRIVSTSRALTELHGSYHSLASVPSPLREVGKRRSSMVKPVIVVIVCREVEHTGATTVSSCTALFTRSRTLQRACNPADSHQMLNTFRDVHHSLLKWGGESEQAMACSSAQATEPRTRPRRT